MKSKSQGSQRIILKAMRIIFPKYPEMNAEIERFINFARNQQFPVVQALMQQRTKIAAENQAIVKFKVSNGNDEIFLRRAVVQNSIRLHGRRDSAVLGNHKQMMAEVRGIAGQYSMSNIYNMDESILQYRMGTRRLYLSGNENPSSLQGTDLQKYKDGIFIVLSANAGESHSVPVRYIGNSAEPRCFRHLRFDSSTLNYDSQKNA